MEVVAGYVASLWCVLVLFVVVHDTVMPIWNIKTTVIKIITVVIIFYSIGIFMWMVHPPIFMCLAPYLLGLKLAELLLSNTKLLSA